MTVYGYRLLGDPRSDEGYHVHVLEAERVTLEGQPFIRQHTYLTSERPGEWFPSKHEARMAAAGELLLLGHRMLALARKEAEA